MIAHWQTTAYKKYVCNVCSNKCYFAGASSQSRHRPTKREFAMQSTATYIIATTLMLNLAPLCLNNLIIVYKCCQCGFSISKAQQHSDRLSVSSCVPRNAPEEEEIGFSSMDRLFGLVQLNVSGFIDRFFGLGHLNTLFACSCLFFYVNA